MNPKRHTVTNTLKGSKKSTIINKLGANIATVKADPLTKYGVDSPTTISQINNMNYIGKTNEDLKNPSVSQNCIFQFPSSRTSIELSSTFGLGGKEELQIIGKSKNYRDKTLPSPKPSTAMMTKRTKSIPQFHAFRKTQSRKMKRTTQMTYKDINELSKKVLIEDLQRKWIKRERASLTGRASQDRQLLITKGTGYADPTSLMTKKDFFKRLGMPYNYGEGKKLNLNIKSIFNKMRRSNFMKRENGSYEKRTQSSCAVKSNHLGSDHKTIFSKRKGLVTSRYNPDYSPQKISQINYGESFSKILKETIIKDIKSDVFREMAHAEGGVPRAIRNSSIPLDFGEMNKVTPLTKKINTQIDLHIKKHSLVLEKCILDRAKGKKIVASNSSN
ncbi:unnamed protein product [Moneuplotes crassus]|uniref:Uncharacterized protein n=1 Tax=Euplotes crassus TaxID=5936 RepID=A0AAD1YAL4_EUPCR|nr:unnamed protein product [Moneuplotes crassus]